MRNERVQKYLRRFEGLKRQRGTWDPQYNDISDYILPYRGRIKDSHLTNDGSRRGQNIINGEATRTMKVLRSGM